MKQQKPEGHRRAEKAQLDFSRDMSYGDYLQLDAILTAQKPLSPDHNEMLFIVQHQTSELWMKLMLHELARPSRASRATSCRRPSRCWRACPRIMEQLVHAWDVLATMTPPEYSAIRPYLANSSGFQSWQYRCIEFRPGQQERGDAQAAFAPSRAAVGGAGGLRGALAVRRGAAPAGAARAARARLARGARLDRSLTRPGREVEAGWLVVYRAPQAHWDLVRAGRGADGPGGRLPPLALTAMSRRWSA
jgi:tryptophan 2,3-dioxygenase